MGEIVATRVDFRLIHGQIITRWRKVYDINKIVVVDDILASDDFMITVYASAVPEGISVKVYSVEKAVRIWNKNSFGDGKKVFLLFKDIGTLEKAVKQGLPIKSVQIGGVPASSGRKTIKGAVSLSADEMKQIEGMADAGIEFTVQVVPEDNKMTYQEIRNSFYQ